MQGGDIVGSFPSLNARPASVFDEWLHQITEELAAWNRDNPIVRRRPMPSTRIAGQSNNRLDEDLAICAKNGRCR